MLPSIFTRRQLLAASLVALGLGLALANLMTRPPAHARAVVAPAAQRIVAAAKQSKVVATYAIRNVGGADLVFGKAFSSCGCSVPTVRPQRVVPGGEATLTVEGTPTPAGAKDVLIQVETNDPTQPKLPMRLTMVGSGAVPYVAFASNAVAFGVVGKPNARDVGFVETREAEASVPWLRSPRISLADADVAVKLTEERPMGEGVVLRRYDLTVNLRGMPEVGDFRGEVLFDSSPGSDPVPLHLPVHGIVRPPVFAVPATLYANFDRGRRPAKLTLNLLSNDSTSQLQVTPLLNSVKLGVRQIEGTATRATFEVEFDRDLEEDLKTELVFTTNLATKSEVRVPVLFIASDP